MKLTTVVKGGATAAGLALAAAAGYVGVQWTRYGHVDPERHPSDPLVDRFLPDPVVDEYHSLRVAAPAPMTFEAAKKMDLQASPFVKGIFALRAIPTMLKGEPLRLGGSESCHSTRPPSAEKPFKPALYLYATEGSSVLAMASCRSRLVPL